MPRRAIAEMHRESCFPVSKRSCEVSSGRVMPTEWHRAFVGSPLADSICWCGTGAWESKEIDLASVDPDQEIDATLLHGVELPNREAELNPARCDTHSCVRIEIVGGCNGAQDAG